MRNAQFQFYDLNHFEKAYDLYIIFKDHSEFGCNEVKFNR